MKYVIANWKMNMGLEEITSWTLEFSDFQKHMKPDVEIIISPSAVHIPMIYEVFKKTGIKIASQDVSTEEKGAHTGDIGAFQIKQFCKYAIVGHSERKEDVQTVIKKRDLCLKEGITPIVCFVEPDNLPKLYKDRVLIAWENPQNISKNGVYNPEDPEIIRTVVKEIRKIIPSEAPLIYGGSVNKQNIEDIGKIEEINGVLVGNASLDPKIFSDMIRYYAAN